MVNINYYYRSKKNDAPLTVRFRYTVNGKRLTLEGKTQEIFSKKYWYKYHQNLKIRDYAMRVMQNQSHSHLNDLTLFLNNSFSSANLFNVDKNWLEKQISFFYNPQLKMNIPQDLLNYISYFLNFRKNSLGIETVKKYQTLDKRIRAFIKTRGKDIMMEDIDENIKLEFENFLIDDEYSIGTISRDIGFIKSLCIHAHERGLDINRQALKMKTKKEAIDSSNIIFLKMDELKKIKMLNNLPQHLETTRRWLFISCFTGQRISDFMRFNKIMIKDNGLNKIIEITQKKGEKNVCIPLYPPVQEILDINEGEFPEKMSQQKYNKHLKTLCEIAKLNQIIPGGKLTKISHKKYRKIKGYYPKSQIVSSHIGRKSFASMFYLKMRLPVLMRITGHSSEAMLLRYIGVSPAEYALEAHKSYDFDF
jgi:integrase